MKKGLLAGLSAREFMRDHWQKAPLLARKALPDYAATSQSKAQTRGARAITKEALFALAARDDVESRIVSRTSTRWSVRHGPFAPRDLARMPSRNWTLLVQGVDQSLPQAASLMSEFRFLPHARLDDVMVSYAVPGGGVGPHFDSYDVFLVQGAGHRRWRTAKSRDLTLVPDMPLKILARFEPDRDEIVEPGDVLYLPPQYAHDGVAVDECITYSVGFRAPGAQELASAFLDFVQDGLKLSGMYSDRGAPPTDNPGRLPRGMVDYAATTLDRLRWTRADVEHFVGCYVTEPKPNVVFTAPSRKRSRAQFAERAIKRGVRLALPTRMLVSGNSVYLNGERLRVPPGSRDALAALADSRELVPGVAMSAELASMLYDWYAAGYIENLPTARP